MINPSQLNEPLNVRSRALAVTHLIVVAANQSLLELTPHPICAGLNPESSNMRG